ncbi:HIT family protein [Candidatus Dependentiae bacterium]|nr:HIT family protein [Candidatus Dependentiae bacterium]
MNTECIFCKIITGELSADKVAESDNIIVIKDKFPKASVHYLIIPKQHYRDLLELDDCSVSGSLIQMARSLSEHNSELRDFKLLINNGYSMGQRVFHVHMHFLAGSKISDFENLI